MTYVKFETIDDPCVYGYRAKVWKTPLYVEVVRHYQGDWRIYVTKEDSEGYYCKVVASNLTARHGSYGYQEAMSMARYIAAGEL